MAQEMFPSPDFLRLFNLMLGTCIVSHFSGVSQIARKEFLTGKLRVKIIFRGEPNC